MAETEDPRAALGDPSVAVRSAAARDLSRMGEFADLERLVKMAISERSSAVRLYAAAAASDILHRYRGLRGGDALSEEQLDQVHRWARSFDPTVNPSLLMILSAAQDDRALARLIRTLRDPRSGVRAGALIALRRMALSAAGQRVSSRISEVVRDCLGDDRFAPDVHTELVRLVGEAGWRDLGEAIPRGLDDGRALGLAEEEARGRLVRREELSGWRGLYVNLGRDVFEGEPAGKLSPTWCLIEGSGWWDVDGRAPFRVEGGLGYRGEAEVLVRMIWAPGFDDASVSVQSLQSRGETWWRISGKELPKRVESLLLEIPEGGGALTGILDELDAMEGATASRVRALVLWRAGRLEEAEAALEGLTSLKKPRADLLWWFGRVLAERSKPDEAATALRRALSLGAARAPWRTEAEALLTRLEG